MPRQPGRNEAMTYKGYAAMEIVLDEESGTISGEVALTRGVATFEGQTVAEAFHVSVPAALAHVSPVRAAPPIV